MLSTADPEVSPVADVHALAGLASASGAWPLANRIFYTPTVLWEEGTVHRMGFLNGATASGNLIVGIYDFFGNKLVDSGAAVAQAGVNSLQVFDVADTLLRPGWYWQAVIASATTTTFIRGTAQRDVTRVTGMRSQDAASMALPATATWTEVANGNMPVECMFMRADTP